MANRSVAYPACFIEDVLVRVGELIFPIASQVLQWKVAEGPQLFVVYGVVAIVVVVVFAAAGLVEGCMVCLGQQHSENKVVVVAAAVVKESAI